MNPLRLVLLGLLLSGCAHRALSGGELDSVKRPAFFAWTLARPGPKSQVFQNDKTYRAKLKTINDEEADRRLAKKLFRGMNRWEVSERLRASTFALLPKIDPWTDTVDPADVAKVLQSLLVEEEGGVPPDYELLKTLDADAIVEFVIEDYGMRSKNGQAGVFLKGYGRMFKLRGGGDMWRRSFEVDQVSDGAAHLDPFKVSKTPDIFRASVSDMIDAVAEQVAKDLTPEGRQLGSKESLPAPGQARPPASAEEEELPEPE
jgi:hypothetical protein